MKKVVKLIALDLLSNVLSLVLFVQHPQLELERWADRNRFQSY